MTSSCCNSCWVCRVCHRLQPAVNGSSVQQSVTRPTTVTSSTATTTTLTSRPSWSRRQNVRPHYWQHCFGVAMDLLRPWQMLIAISVMSSWCFFWGGACNCWHGGIVVRMLDLTTNRSLHITTLGMLFTHVPLFTKQYNLIPANGWWCSFPPISSTWPHLNSDVGLESGGSEILTELSLCYSVV